MRHVAVLLVLLFASACSKDDDANAAAAPPGGGQAEMKLPVEAVVLKPESLSRSLGTVGTLRADESVVMRPEVAGRIVRIHFREGQRVAAGAPMFSLDASVLSADLHEARATLENNRRANERVGQLAGQQLLSRSDADQARADLGVSEARVASTSAQLAKTVIRAPFSGVAGLREVSVGEVVEPGQALVNLVQLDPLEVDFSVPESDLGQLAPGRPVSVVVDAFPDQAFEGEVVAIEPVIDPDTRSAKLRARIGNPGLRLRPGQFARVTLGTGEQQAKALLVPEQALMQEGDTRYVYAIADGKAKRVEVTTGQRVPGRVEVTSGLKAGDQVVVAGQAKPMMRDGVPLMVMPAQEPGAAKPAPAPAPAAAAPR